MRQIFNSTRHTLRHSAQAAALFSIMLLGACSSNNSGSSGSSSTSSTSSSTTSSTSSSTSSSSGATDYESADGINGGRLYSKFWAEETGFTLANSNLSEQSELDDISSHGDFYRCKQCHGWDRLGRDGGYSDRAPRTTRPNVANVDLATTSDMLTPQALFDAIQTGGARRELSDSVADYDPDTNSVVGDRMPNFGAILTDAQIWDIVKYLKEEANDTSELYTLTLGSGTYPNRERSFSEIGLDGDVANGNQVFADNCASCHGDYGTLIQVDGDYTVGAHVRAKPYEDQHKVKFGHLGSTMGAILADAEFDDIKDLLKALSDSDMYPDTVPNGVTLFENNCGGCHSANGMGGGSDRSDRTVTQINNAIANIGAMSGLSSLVPAEIAAIAEAIVSPPVVIDGAALFTDNCSACHTANGLGSGATDKTNATAQQITNAIANQPQMSSFSSLTSDEIDAIATAIAN